ncbi:LacI family DNA-binding transcriptional regulator [Virgibacillus halophilus]|uniref:LacI family DNA-binding transcriptional regulator n=1 Tax=Tigheibacillus halophilus TaxID=361280 RepID=A0ABU5C311_9BACI|nr:LacI family DNA-binding transcriptional regulator [Virgibacillus halophilus]
MKLTIKDIAKMANVSRGTVSKVINGSGSLSQQTIDKVNKIIEETGYQPTFSAKLLATKKVQPDRIDFCRGYQCRDEPPGIQRYCQFV